jgi:hypothetical protein
VEHRSDNAQDPSRSLSHKLQDFYDTLPQEEKLLMRALLMSLEDDDVAGYAQSSHTARFPVRSSFGPRGSEPVGPEGIVEITF